MNNSQIEALLTERAGYVLRKLPARVAAVDAALAALGYKNKPETETASVNTNTETASVSKRSKRTAD
jgi:hypothetical protein